MVALLRIRLVLFTLLAVHYAHGQTTILFQGFESPAPCGAWGYTGGVVNPEIARNGVNSARVGRNLQSHTITFNTVSVAGLANLQLSVWHAVRPGMGPGMDVLEGAVLQVALDGLWSTVGTIHGSNDHTYDWMSPSGGAVGTSCTDYILPNPFVYNVPGGTSTLAFRVMSVRNTNCAQFNLDMAAPTPGNYDRNDEGFFIDDVTLSTTTPAPYPFIWTGAEDTDWHKCTNWNFGVVPTVASNVFINDIAVNQCEVYTAAAVCASLSVSSSTASTWGLTIRQNFSLTVGGAVTVSRTGASITPVGITLGDASWNGSLVAASLTMTGTGPGALNAFVRNERPLSILRILGPVTIQQGGHLDLQGAAAGGQCQLQGDYTNNDSEAALDEQFSLFVWWGGATQSVNTAGFQERFGAFRMSKSAGDLTLNAPISMRTANPLQFTGASPLGGGTPGGRVFSSFPNGLLSLESTVLGTTNATDASHVDGPVEKFGTANFIYPIGKIGRFRPVQVQAIAGAATDAFIAEYFPLSAYSWGSNMEPTLDHISACEYWSIDRSVGTANARVVLSYSNAYSCGVTLPADLRVAKWDDAALPPIWRDRGNNGISTTIWGGYVPTTNVETEFGIWTLASVSSENPLPIELVSFTAQAKEPYVACEWVTASELNNAYFTVERSADGIHFEEVGVIPGAGNSWSMLSYNFLDREPLRGLSYYRLRQTDLDGTSVVSAIVPVQRASATGVELVATGQGVQLFHQLPAGTAYEVLDASGRLLTRGQLSDAVTAVPLPNTSNAVYILRFPGLAQPPLRFYHSPF